MTDDQTRESLRVMRAVQGGIGGQGTTFERAFATYPLCCPSRATALTGQYPHNHGVIHNAGPNGGYQRLNHRNALPVWLRNAGYRTIQLGRYLNGYGVQNDPAEVPPGWTDWHATVDPTTFHYRNWLMNDNGTVKGYPDRPGEHQTDFLGRRAVELIDEAAPSAEPFFLHLTFPAPHSGHPRDPDDPERSTPHPALRHRDVFANEPLPQPPNFNEADVSDKPAVTYDRDPLGPEQIAGITENYQQELESLLSVDDAVAHVIRALERSGELGNTLIVFTSDNGFMHGEHRWPGEKVVAYEPSIRVPLVMRGPGIPAGRRERRMVANVDLVPTLLDAANAPAGRVMDGRSLFQLVSDPGAEWGREILLENGYGANRVPGYRAIRNERFLYVAHRTGERELYDLERDPYQLQNLDGDLRYEDLQLAFGKRLRTLQRCRGSRCRARPALGLALTARTRRGRRRVRCMSGRSVRMHLVGRDQRSVQRADVFVGAARLTAVRRRPFRTIIRRGRLRSRGANRLRVRVTTRDGRRVTLDRRLVTC
jgi:N-acetylglucosamine-6-sulfatase